MPSRRRWLVAVGAVVLLLLAGGAVALVVGLGPTGTHSQAADPPPPTTADPTTADPTTADPTTAAPTTTALPSPTGPPPFDRTQNSIDEANSIWVVVDKLRPLNPIDYAPADLVDVGNGHQMRAEAAAALHQMFADAAAQGLRLDVDSAYRSYVYQQNTFASGVARLGEAQALRGIAKPGYSEHQTGLAADIGGGGCEIDPCFATTPQGQWVAQNAYRYGFVIRYPDGAEGVTGYRYEPWHVRYVGVALATEMRTEGVPTLEQFFALPAAPSYAG
ncbi:M15 family metallopeptidase [Petropleomorpha daqingensis]|uniref:D-alanyl-D-alanine carboxypeptidase n=1 Tax=Petropleomorpha daqingensis TaxID=2026353 RepID=A0A853CEQ9_9ACTN|nr:D-alanyl-D-alanine carboxypeptidase [Petropleomorpha daqingensis]